MIKKIALEHDLNIIIKLHPKEIGQNLYKRAFDSGSGKVNWKFSVDHPFSLGKNCQFAVSFYSGVPLDLLQLGVPTIELSDFRGIDHDDHPNSLRNTRGEAVREYRYLNLVLGATTFEEFQNHVKKIFSDKQKVINDLNKNYSKIFKHKMKSSDIISDEIINAFNEM